MLLTLFRAWFARHGSQRRDKVNSGHVILELPHLLRAYLESGETRRRICMPHATPNALCDPANRNQNRPFRRRTSPPTSACQNRPFLGRSIQQGWREINLQPKRTAAADLVRWRLYDEDASGDQIPRGGRIIHSGCPYPCCKTVGSARRRPESGVGITARSALSMTSTLEAVSKPQPVTRLGTLRQWIRFKSLSTRENHSARAMMGLIVGLLESQ